MKQRVLCYLTLAAAVVYTVASPRADEPGWPEIFDPFVLRTFNLVMDPQDWNTIRYDTTNEIEVPAWFSADAETPILVSVRHKSSRALPSESNPVKIGIKIDINEFQDQEWHDLVKLSLENGGDISPLAEGLAWNLHERADAYYGAAHLGISYHPGLANWVRLNINGEYIGFYTSVEQRDKRHQQNRELWLKNFTWLYEVDDISAVELEEGDPHSPTFTALCYEPFWPGSGKGNNAGSCPRPDDATLETELDALIEMNAMLTQGAVDAFTDNDDALLSHGKNFLFADFTHDGLKRRYYPWDLDSVFRRPNASIYGEVSKRGRVTQSPYQDVILNHPGLRDRYNEIMLALVTPPGPLSKVNLHAFLDALLPVVDQAIADDPYINESASSTIGALKSWITARIDSVQTQALVNEPPPR